MIVAMEKNGRRKVSWRYDRKLWIGGMKKAAYPSA